MNLFQITVPEQYKVPEHHIYLNVDHIEAVAPRWVRNSSGDYVIDGTWIHMDNSAGTDQSMYISKDSVEDILIGLSHHE